MVSVLVGQERSLGDNGAAIGARGLGNPVLNPGGPGRPPPPAGASRLVLLVLLQSDELLSVDIKQSQIRNPQLRDHRPGQKGKVAKPRGKLAAQEAGCRAPF